MAKTRIKTFRRNSRRKRNTRRIKGGNPTMDLVLRLPNLLKSPDVNDVTKQRVSNGVNSEMVKLYPGGITGSLIKSQYIIQRKIRKMACGKTRLFSYGNKTEECKKAIADMKALKGKGTEILSYFNRTKLSHKTLGGITSSLLSYILISSMRMYENEKLHSIVKTCLQLFFTDAVLSFEPLTEPDKILLLTFKKVSISSKDEKKVDQDFNKLNNDEEKISEKTSVLPDIMYDKFKEIVGTDTITSEEFEALKIIYIDKFESGKTTGGGNFYEVIEYDEGNALMMLTVYFFCGFSNIFALPINILWALLISCNEVGIKWRKPESVP